MVRAAPSYQGRENVNSSGKARGLKQNFNQSTIAHEAGCERLKATIGSMDRLRHFKQHALLHISCDAEEDC